MNSNKEVCLKMRLIKQLDRHGCTVACLAMLLNKDYYTIRQLLDLYTEILPRLAPPKDPKKSSVGFDLSMYPHEITQILKALDPGIECEYIKWEQSLKDLILLSVVPIDSYRTAHAVVCDGEQEVIYDPMLDEPIGTKEYLKDCNIVNAIQIK